MQYPLISEYVRAIQDASSNLDKLAHLVPVLDDHGEPYRSSGAFAVVFSHPLRTVDDFDETIDDFSLASIALSLKAISMESVN